MCSRDFYCISRHRYKRSSEDQAESIRPYMFSPLLQGNQDTVLDEA